MKAVELRLFLKSRGYVDINGNLYSYGPTTYKIEINKQKVCIIPNYSTNWL